MIAWLHLALVSLIKSDVHIDVEGLPRRNVYRPGNFYDV